MHHPENTRLLETLKQRAWFRSSKDYTEWAEKTFEKERLVAQRNKVPAQ